jgi:ABC-type multidrug transport system ATPase subunit
MAVIVENHTFIDLEEKDVRHHLGRRPCSGLRGRDKGVDNVSLHVQGGEFFGFLGPNGAGKSTTIKVLGTLLKKTSGSVSIGGHDIDKEANMIRKIIGVQSQETVVDGEMTGRQNLMFQGAPSKDAGKGSADQG